MEAGAAAVETTAEAGVEATANQDLATRIVAETDTETTGDTMRTGRGTATTRTGAGGAPAAILRREDTRRRGGTSPILLLRPMARDLGGESDSNSHV